MCDNCYNKPTESGIFCAAPEIDFDRKISINDATISEKDMNQPLFKDANNSF